MKATRVDDFMFGTFPGIFMTIWWILFIGFMSIFIVGLGRNIKQWKKNNDSPRLIVNAKIVGKRNHVSHHMHGGGNHVHRSTSTDYYVTFEVESGDRMELEVSGNEYGMLVEGDEGNLSFQGTRYLGFDRNSR